MADLLHGQSRHSRWLARAALIGLSAAALYGLYLVPVTLANPIWPLGHHARLLPAIGVVLGWVGAGIAVGYAAVLTVAFLVRRADL